MSLNADLIRRRPTRQQQRENGTSFQTRRFSSSFLSAAAVILFLVIFFVIATSSAHFSLSPSSPFQMAEASGFLRWTRTYDGYVNATNSAAGVTVVVGPSASVAVDGTYTVSVLNFTSGVILVQATIEGPREPIVIRPQETSSGQFTCVRLAQGAMRGELRKNASWAPTRVDDSMRSHALYKHTFNVDVDGDDEEYDESSLPLSYTSYSGKRRRFGGASVDDSPAIGDDINTTTALWCAIFLFSSHTNADPLMLFPNGAVRPMIPDGPPVAPTTAPQPSSTLMAAAVTAAAAPVPWNCEDAHHCMVRTPEQQSRSIGGCFRRSDPWPYPPNYFAPQSSHVVIVDASGNIFSFRPLEVALLGSSAIRVISQPPVPIWRSPSLGWDAAVQYMAFTHATTIQFAHMASIERQGAICALTFVGVDGSMMLFDADREDNTTITGLPFLGGLNNHFSSSNATVGQNKNNKYSADNAESNGASDDNATACYPWTQTVRRMTPATTDDLTFFTPLEHKVYGTVLSVNCRDGRGWLWNVQITENDPILVKPTEPVNMTFESVGSYETPSEFSKTIATMPPTDPLSTDIEITLIQPIVTLTTPNGHATSKMSGQVMQFVTSIAALRYLPHTYSLLSTDTSDDLPPLAILTFISDIETAHHKNLPNLTYDCVGSFAVRQVNVMAGSSVPTVHNVTHSVGWIAAQAGIPAWYNTSLTTSDITSGGPLELQKSAVRAVSQWFANYGMVYSVLCDIVHVMLNSTNGRPIDTSHLRVNFDQYSGDGEGAAETTTTTFFTTQTDTMTAASTTTTTETPPPSPTPAPFPPKPIFFGITGGVKQAAPVALDPFRQAMALTPILDWQDGASQVNRSVLHNRATILTPSASAPNQPTCVYSLKANAMAIIFNINGIMTMKNDANTKKDDDRIDVGSLSNNSTSPYDDVSFGNWVTVPSNRVLYNPYTQNFCMATIIASASSALSMAPAGNSVIIVQVSSTADVDVSRITVNPLRDLIDQTAQVSYGLGRNESFANDTYQPQTLHPIGTPMIYVCGKHTLHAYYGVIGNLTWSMDLTNVTGCETCHCNQDATAGDGSLLLSTDRKFIVLVVDNVLPSGLTTETVMMLDAGTGGLIRFVDPITIQSRTSECSNNVATANFGDMIEIPLSETGITGYSFLAIIPLVSTRCFTYVAIQDPHSASPSPASRTTQAPSTGAVGELFVFFFLGTSTSVSQSFQIMQGVAFLNTQPEAPNLWAGHYVYGIDIQTCVSAMLATDPINPIGALPLFAANNVIDCVAFGAVLFAVQVVVAQNNYVYLRLNTFVPTVSPSPRWSATLNHFPQNKFDLMQNASVFIVRNMYVCVASGPLQCYGATADGGAFPSYYLDGTVVQHFGQPAVDQWGAVIFSTPPFAPHAIRFADGDANPTYSWTALSWPGSDQGVEMNVDQSSCVDPQITNKGLVLVCDLQYNPLNTKNQRHLVIVESTTGTVLLADGPWARPKSVIISDSGIQIVYINNLATAVSIQLVAMQELIPLHFSGSLCAQQEDAVYALYIVDGMFTAKRTPTNVTEPSVEISYYQQTYAYEWIGFDGLRLGRTYIAAGTELMSKLYPALPPNVVSEGFLHFFVGNSLSVMNSNFNIALMDTSMCDVCAVGCPSVCTVELLTGNQFMYEFQPMQYITTPKPNGTMLYNPSKSYSTIETFSGSVTLDMNRKVASMAPFQEVVACVNTSTMDSMTLVAPSGRFCLLNPRLNYKRWVVVQLSGGHFAGTTMYSSPWNAVDSFTSTEQAMLTIPYVIDGWTAVSTMLNTAMPAGAFPDDLNGDATTSVDYVVVETNGNESTMSVFTTDPSAAPVVLSNQTCVEMEGDIPMCLDQILFFDEGSMADEKMMTVTWNGVDDSNWGVGFIATGYTTSLSKLMRTPARGAPKSCSDAASGCAVQCQPTVGCASQVNNYLNQVLYAAAFLPKGSTVPYPLVQLVACSLYTQSNNAKTSPPTPSSTADNEHAASLLLRENAQRSLNNWKHSQSEQNQSTVMSNPLAHLSASNELIETPGDLEVRFMCLRGGRIAIITDLSSGQPTGKVVPNVIAALMNQDALMSIGASFECTECTYFLLSGVVAEPFGWLGAGAVKNLIVCILFYWMMEKVKERQRELNENRRRHKRHEKQIRLIDQRLRDIMLFERRIERKMKRILAHHASKHGGGKSGGGAITAATASGVGGNGGRGGAAAALLSQQYLGVGGSTVNGGSFDRNPFDGASSYVMLNTLHAFNSAAAAAGGNGNGPLRREQVENLQVAERLREMGLHATQSSVTLATTAGTSATQAPHANGTINNNDASSSRLMFNSAEFPKNLSNRSHRDDTVGTDSNVYRPPYAYDSFATAGGDRIIGDGNTNDNLGRYPQDTIKTLASHDSSSISDATLYRVNTDSEPLFSPLLRLPRTFNKDVGQITNEEREIEKIELRRELDRSRIAIAKIREEKAVIQRGRWWCSRQLPNPIALYAKMVVAMGRFRRFEDRRLQVNRVKDNFVYKEFSPDSLVEMLSAILGESADNRPQVVSFAHFYQWNLCDNRQWVIREHVDEQSQYASPEVLEGMENELLALQQQLQDVYVMYKMAFKNNLTVDASEPFVLDGEGYQLSKTTEHALLDSATSAATSSRPQSDAGGGNGDDDDTDDDDDDDDNYCDEDEEDENNYYGSRASRIDARASVGHAFKRRTAVAKIDTRKKISNFLGSGGGKKPSKKKRSGGDTHLLLNDDDDESDDNNNEKRNNKNAANNHHLYSARDSANLSPNAAAEGNNSPTTNSSPPPGGKNSKRQRKTTKSIRQQRRQRLEKVEEQFRKTAQKQYLENVKKEINQRVSQQHFSISRGSGNGGGGSRSRGTVYSGNQRTTGNSLGGKSGGANTNHNSTGNHLLLSKQAINAAVAENLIKNVKFQGMDAYTQPLTSAVVSAAAAAATQQDVFGHVPMPHSYSSRNMNGGGGGGGVSGSLRRSANNFVSGVLRTTGGNRRGSGQSAAFFTSGSRGVDNGGGGGNSENHWSDNPSTEYKARGQSLGVGGASPAPKHPPSPSKSDLLLPPTSATVSSSALALGSAEAQANAGGFSYENPIVPGTASAAAAGTSARRLSATPASTGDNNSFGSGGAGGTSSQYVTEAEGDDDNGGAGNVQFDEDEEPNELMTMALAQHELFKLMEMFNHFHELKPHCFEYASLPSRKIDDKLLPSPLLIIFSLLETLITIFIYGWDVFARTYNGRDGTIRAFDLYQCVFFMVFNSSLPSSLIVNVIARADLGKTTHTKNALEKVKDIVTNPYVVLTSIIFAAPFVTHVLPGFIVFVWMMGPAIGISCVLEFYLRTRVTVHSHSVVVARLIARVLVLFVVSVVMSLSYNYSTSFIWGEDGYLATGSYHRGSYWEIVVNDFNSRSFKCTWDHVVYAVSNFIQMGFFFL